MINIIDIQYGWATLNIGYCSFDVSYLSDSKEEIEYLLSLDVDMYEGESRKVYLEGESQGDLTLISYLTFGCINPDEYGYILNIVWQRLFCDEIDGGGVTVMKFPFEKFKDEWSSLKKDMKDDYIKNFICPQSDEEYESELERY